MCKRLLYVRTRYIYIQEYLHHRRRKRENILIYKKAYPCREHRRWINRWVMKKTLICINTNINALFKIKKDIYKYRLLCLCNKSIKKAQKSPLNTKNIRTAVFGWTAVIIVKKMMKNKCKCDNPIAPKEYCHHCLRDTNMTW